MTTNLISGCDISSIQGSIDFTQLSNKYKFVICRCHVGNDYKDSKYDSNVQLAKEAGMSVGAYHFAYPLPEVAGKLNHSPDEQAILHYESAKDSVNLVVLDLEWPSVQKWKQWNCSANQIKDWTKQYLLKYEELSGKKPVLYSYPNFLDCIKFDNEFAASYDLWIASYTKNPRIPLPWTDYVIWQYGGGSSITFNNIPIDTDYCKDLQIFL